MRNLRFTLVTDGSSDRVLLKPLTWLLRQHVDRDIAFQLEWADLRALREKPHTLREKMDAAVDLFPCDLLFVHRDAERDDPAQRRREIEEAKHAASAELPPVVCVVPVRMTEAWFLFDEAAIRLASGNPSGRDSLDLPAKFDPQSLPDPKTLLHEAVRRASGLRGRRLKHLDVRAAIHRVAERIEDFSPLHKLSAFQRLKSDLVKTLARQGR